MILKARQEQGKTMSIRELEELQQVLDDFGIYNTMNLIDTLKNIQILEKQNAVNSKKIKALEIIKEKNVDVGAIKNCVNAYAYNCFKELSETKTVKRETITQEEFDLLKEIMQ